MSKKKFPIIAHGEIYMEVIKKKGGGGSKPTPNEYYKAKEKLLNDIDQIFLKIKNKEEIFLDEKVICVRMEPKFEAKSYVPESIIKSSEEMKIIGGRKYKLEGKTENEINEEGKLYFIKTNDLGIRKLENILKSSDKDNTKEWRKQIESIRSLDLLKSEEKILGFTNKWEKGNVEIVLHPIGNNVNKALNIFYEVSKIPKENIRLKTYEEGLTFISTNCSKEEIERIKSINILRTVHPIGNVDIKPIRKKIERKAPIIMKNNIKSSIKVGVFDGGANSEVSLLKGFVDSLDCVDTTPVENYVSHGTGVCGAILHGDLANKTANDILPIPSVSIESYRVLPLSDNSDFELYEAIDAIEKVVKNSKDTKLYNISFGPVGPIMDDTISRFTYSLDRLSYDVSEGEVNPLFCVAVGNDGDLEYPLNRIQSPSDLVNGLGIGAYTIKRDGTKIKADYSCVGKGREGAKKKPDLLEFGGSHETPFILASIEEGGLVSSSGTSFSSPLVVNKIGNIMAKSKNITPHIARALLIHNAEISDEISLDEQGHGLCEENVDNILNCEDNRVTILYSGEIIPSQTISLPIFSPKISEMKGNVEVAWTIATIVDPFINDADAYTSSCIEDTFIPHDMKFNFYKKEGSKTKKKVINFLKEGSSKEAEELMKKGYIRSSTPVSETSKYLDEEVLKTKELKWDTIIHKFSKKRASSLVNPSLNLHALNRNGVNNKSIKYFVVVTIDVPKYKGSLYDEILQQYRDLNPIEIRNVNKLMVEI